jgi:hypothetical protein
LSDQVLYDFEPRSSAWRRAFVIAGVFQAGRCRRTPPFLLVSRKQNAMHTSGEIGMSHNSLSFHPGWTMGSLFLAAGVTVSMLLLFVERGVADDGLGYTDTPRLPNSRGACMIATRPPFFL